MSDQRVLESEAKRENENKDFLESGFLRIKGKDVIVEEKMKIVTESIQV